MSRNGHRHSCCQVANFFAGTTGFLLTALIAVLIYVGAR